MEVPLSTSLSFPCSGTAVIPFTPVDGGPLARNRVTLEPAGFPPAQSS
ncbi:MAG: hypothetical protein ACLP0J_10305 [Solirubrobacteraceae bacterium]